MDPYQSIKDHFSQDSRVTVNSGKGAQGIKVPVKGKDKMVIMFSKGDLLIQLSPDQVTQYISEGRGLPYDPGTGKAMKDRLLITASKNDSWIKLAEHSITWALSQ
jgi:hypothetical protein